MSQKAPVVALASPNGWLGKAFTPTFVDHVRNGDFSALHFVTTKFTDELKAAEASLPGKIKVFETSYNQETLGPALKGVDVLVNVMGFLGKVGEAQQALIEAAAAQGVKVYFPSEFGSDYDEVNYGDPIFATKKNHAEAAEKLGVKTVSIATSAFMPALELPHFVQDNVWNVTGDASTHYALCDMGDIARYSARAVVLAYAQPDAIPRRLRVYSDLKTWNEYIAIKEKVSGEQITKKSTSQADLEEQYKSGKEHPFFIFNVVRATKAHDFTGADHNELLNPGEKYFKTISYEAFLKRQLKEKNTTA